MLKNFAVQLIAVIGNLSYKSEFLPNFQNFPKLGEVRKGHLYIYVVFAKNIQ